MEAIINVPQSNQYSKFNGQSFPVRTKNPGKGNKMIYSLEGVSEFLGQTVDFIQDEVVCEIQHRKTTLNISKKTFIDQQTLESVKKVKKSVSSNVWNICGVAYNLYRVESFYRLFPQDSSLKHQIILL